MADHLCAYTSMMRSRNHQSKHRSSYLKDNNLVAHPDSHKLHANCSWNTCTAVCYGARMWGMGSCYRAELKLMKINWNLLSKPSSGSCKPSNRHQTSKIDIPEIFLPVQLLSRWGDKLLVLCIPPSSQNPPSNTSLFILWDLSIQK